jgi:hypothetical protein
MEILMLDTIAVVGTTLFLRVVEEFEKTFEVRLLDVSKCRRLLSRIA